MGLYKRINNLKKFLRIHLFPRRAELSGNLKAALEDLLFISDEHACDGDVFADSIFHIDHIFREPVI